MYKFNSMGGTPGGVSRGAGWVPVSGWLGGLLFPGAAIVAVMRPKMVEIVMNCIAIVDDLILE
jgi:hypothetical protein